jgi:amidophosphoribosyltransferase
MTSDTEVISYIIIKERLRAPSIEQAINQAMYRLKGAYSLVIMSPSKLIAVRDEHGFRPLCYGIRSDGSYVVASESCALAAVGAKLVRDLEPGRDHGVLDTPAPTPSATTAARRRTESTLRV